MLQDTLTTLLQISRKYYRLFNDHSQLRLAQTSSGSTNCEMFRYNKEEIKTFSSASPLLADSCMRLFFR